MYVKNQSQQSHDLEFDLNVKEIGKKKTLTYKAKLDNGKVILKRGGERPLEGFDIDIVRNRAGLAMAYLLH